MDEKTIITELLKKTLNNYEKEFETVIFENYSYFASFYNNNFNVKVFLKQDVDCFIDFYTEFKNNIIMIDGIRVPDILQRKGIGTKLFEILKITIDIINSLDYCKVNKIIGELSIFEYPYDQFEKSIPFYKKQARLNNWKIIFYKFDEAYNEYEMNDIEVIKFMKKQVQNGKFEILL